MLLIGLIKFIHLLCVMGILGAVFYCIRLIYSKKFHHPHSRSLLLRLNWALLCFGAVAMLTGTLMVHPKHFTFHTPWIQAAYLLVSIFLLSIALFLLTHNKPRSASRPLALFSYAILLVLLLVVVHDAVAKTTFLL